MYFPILGMYKKKIKKKEKRNYIISLLNLHYEYNWSLKF